jgi:hypothetical protein
MTTVVNEHTVAIRTGFNWQNYTVAGHDDVQVPQDEQAKVLRVVELDENTPVAVTVGGVKFKVEPQVAHSY